MTEKNETKRSESEKRNVAEMNPPDQAGNTLVGMIYLSVAGSAFVRVQEGEHSFVDWLVKASRKFWGSL
jgi:hypothetical protein